MALLFKLRKLFFMKSKSLFFKIKINVSIRFLDSNIFKKSKKNLFEKFLVFYYQD